jgi:hypothetical protein
MVMGKLVHAIGIMLLVAMAGTLPSFSGALSSDTAGATVAGSFRLGPTGIYCVKAPCPWRGIVKIGPAGQSRGRPLWSGDSLPPIHAIPSDRERILAAWRKSGCLIVDGEFRRATLFVSRISGLC